MKLIQLSIHNIASIEDAVIDFIHGPLGEDSQFLICGPTGAGKTTLLDAICVALYGTTPRLHSTRNETYVDYYEKFTLSGKREDIKIDDPRMLMRRGSLDCSVELIFTDKDDVLLKAIWSCSRAHNKLSGNIKASEWVLIDVKEDNLISSKKSEVQHLIEERIGMTFEQFCRTTMLAQGDFTRFLKSEENKKSEILEKLTGTAVFSEIGARIYQKKNEKESFRDQIKSRLEGVQLMTEEERKECVEQLKSVQEKIQILNREEQGLQAQINWTNQWNNYQTEWNQSIVALQNLQEKVETESFKDEETMLANWDKSQSAREWYRNSLNADQMLEKKKEEAKILEADYRQLCAGFAAFVEEQKNLEARREKILAYIDKEKIHEETYRQIGVIVSLVSQRKEIRLQVETAGKEINNLYTQIEKLTSLLEGQQQAAQQVKSLVGNKQQELEAATSKLEGLDYEGLLQQKNQCTQQVTSLKEYLSLSELAIQATKTNTEKKAALDELAQHLVADRQHQVEYQKKEQFYLQQVENQQKLYDQQKLACEDLMKEVRHHLKVGDICPLCGQQIVSLSSDEHFVSILQPVQEMLQEAQKQYQEALKNLSEQNALLQAHQQEEERITKEYQSACQQQEQFLQKVQQHPLFDTYPYSSELKDVIADKIKEQSLQMNALDAQLKEVGTQQSVVAKLQKEKAQWDEKLHQTEEVVKGTEKNLSEVKQSLASQQAMVTSGQKALSENSSQLGAYLSLEQFQKEGETYLAKLQKDAALYQKAHDTLEMVQKNLQSYALEEEHISSSRSAILQVFPQWKDSSLLPAQTIERLSAQWVQLQSRVVALYEVVQQASHQKGEAREKLTEYYASPDAIAEADLLQLISIPLAEIEKVRKAHQTLRDELLQGKTRVDTARKHLEAHESQKPAKEERVPLESLLEQEQSKKKELEEVNQQSGKIQQCLENDDQNKLRFASICKELEQAEKDVNQWAHLSHLFGSAKGDKFRNIAQSYVLEQLLINANQYLHLFTERYEMECQPGSLTILLKDREAGGVLRPTSTISGGESFLISLSLALGLSSLSRSSFSMDTLFIDEGFGTLDSTYLSTVIDALERLHQIGGKKIGIISHVESLKERITTQIQVTRVNSTSSKVEITSLV